MSLSVFYYAESKQGSPEALRSRLPDGTKLIYGKDIPEPADFDVLVAAFPSEELLEASPNLKAVIIPFAGPPKQTQDLLRNYPHLSLHNTPYNYVPTAETALALMMASAKFMVKGDRELRQGDWTLRFSEKPQLVLQERTALILGYGRIGQHMAPVCKALGMDVIGLKRTVSTEDKADPHASVHEVGELETLLPKADILLIALPETPDTIGLIGEKELANLPEDAVLVNVGRGAVVDEKALFEALTTGKLAAAGLDVWYSYPRKEEERSSTLPSQLPFHELDNVIMSPHKAGWLGSEDNSRMVVIAQMLNAYAAGNDMPNRVDLSRGY